jgi:tetratricopeptide (TPR) repeat protein
MGSSSECLSLEVLDQKAAFETIDDLAKHSPLLARSSEAQRADLYAKTGGNPLLLRWTAGQLGRGSCRTLADALSFLASCPPGNDPLEFIFGAHAKEFTETETKILCTLTHFGLPAQLKHLADITGLRQEAVAVALRILANQPFVVPDQEEKAYALVPMVAEFLRKRSPEVVAETGTQIQKGAYVLIMENGGIRYDRFPAIDAAWPAVDAALPLFVAGPNADLQAVCGAIYAFLNFKGRWDELRSLNHEAEAKALAVADKHHAGWRAYHAGLGHHRRGESDLLRGCCARSDEHWRDASPMSSGPGLAAHLRGQSCRLEGDFPAAIASYHAALDHARSISSESRDVAIFLADLADAELSSGDREAAERDLREGLRIANAVGEDQVRAGCMIRLARLALEQGDRDSAETQAREALGVSELIDRREFIADASHCLADALLAAELTSEALPYARSAVDIYSQLHSPKTERACQTMRKCEG